MASEHWFRWHHGTINDPKWRVVASRASKAMSRDVTVGHVVSIWSAMMENASQANPRGTLSNWSDEDVAFAFGYEESEVCAVREAMQGKTLDGNELTGWNRRQIKVEDATAADRKRAQREREKTQKVTESHDLSQKVTDSHDRGEERREDKKDQEKGGRTFKRWLESLPEGRDAIPPTDPVFKYADKVGIPREFLELSWAEFERKMLMSRKRQSSWPQTYRNYVEGNWLKLWWVNTDGEYGLTTVGQQAKRATA